MGKEVQWSSEDKRCDACAEKDISAEMCKHVRGGKTKEDRANGSWGNRFANRAARTEWGADARSTNATFPRHTCNGQKNRFGA